MTGNYPIRSAADVAGHGGDAGPSTNEKITPQQVRRSCATLLLNAGAPILTVQTLLGHRRIDATLRYARLYDGTVAAHYYRAMVNVEQRLQLAPTPEQPPVNTG